MPDVFDKFKEYSVAEFFKQPFRGDTPLKCLTPSNPPRC